MHHDYQAIYTTTWHYIFVKPNPRLLKYQLLTAHTHAATVEDQPEYVHSIAVSGTPGCPDRCTDAKVLELLMAATAPNTRRAYDSDIAQFLAWGGAIPSTPQVVARY